MNVIDWLMNGDPSLKRLTAKYLLETERPYEDDGYIRRYLDLYDPQTGLWGGGVYGPKWISTHYTMFELMYMEIAPENPAYHTGLGHLLDHEWRTLDMTTHHDGQDVCVLAMVVAMGAYGHSKDVRILEMIDFILEHQMPDGGWNCSWDSTRRPTVKSSLHTTLSVLEAFATVIENDGTHKIDKIRQVQLEGEAFILKKGLFRSVGTGEIINPDFIKFHYPARWKYDAFRALEYFARVGRDYDPKMQEALDLVVKGIQKGYALKGSPYSGKLHFKLEETKAGRFNTLKALRILKAYVPEVYQQIIIMDNPLLDNFS